jgi:TIR domain
LDSQFTDLRRFDVKLFISWSGTRSRALGNALRSWLPKVIPDLSFFHSEDIPKGKNWHTALVDGLRGCPLGIFCITPESLRSPWMMFEAGALAQHGDEPTLLTYTLGAVSLDGPLSHFQATKFERADSRRFVQDLGAILGIEDGESVLRRFDESWEDFESEVRKTTHAGLEELVPGFFSLFRNKKTFHEPFPECTDKRWEDRLRRTAETHALLSRPDVRSLLAGDMEVENAYEALLAALDRYRMHIGSLLLTRAEFGDLKKEDQDRLEETRKSIVRIVEELRTTCAALTWR